MTAGVLTVTLLRSSSTVCILMAEIIFELVKCGQGLPGFQIPSGTHPCVSNSTPGINACISAEKCEAKKVKH